MFYASWPAILWGGVLRLTADLLAFIGPWWIEDILDYCNQFHKPQSANVIQNASTLMSAAVKSAAVRSVVTVQATAIPYSFTNKTITESVAETIKRVSHIKSI